MKRLLLAFIVALPLSATTVREAVETAVSTPPFDRAIWFVLIEEEDGRVIYDRNATLLAIPASVRKLFAASTVINCLGTSTRLETELWGNGDDLIIKGDGDPSFGASRYERTLGPFIQPLRSRGIHRVHDLIADVSLFDRVTIPYQWKVGNLISDDAAAVDALAYDENQVKDFAIASPPMFALLAFREELLRNGIAVEGSLRLQTEPRAWGEKIAMDPSPFIQQLLGTVLRNSHNLYAEMLYKRVSAGLEPASYIASREIESEFLENEVGVSRDEFRFVDGSGLAPDDLVTAVGVLKMLRWLNVPERRPLSWDVMAQPGAEGSLRSRLLPLADRLRAKTGSVAGVNSLAGFVRGSKGDHRYFVVIVNHHIGSGGAAVKLIDSIVEAVAAF